MKKKVKNWIIVILVGMGLVFLFCVAVPKMFEWALISDVREASQRNTEYQQRRTESYPKITKKLELLRVGKIKLSNEEVETLITIRSGLIEEPRPWLLSEFKKLLGENDKHFLLFLEENLNDAKEIKSWIQGEIQLSDEGLKKLMDSYHGYIEVESSLGNKL